LLRSFFLVFILFLNLFLYGCVNAPEPTQPWAFARTALESAKQADAPRLSPGHWHRAEEAYRKAQILYQEREYKDAAEYFMQAQLAAEKAENAARFLKWKNGESL